MTAGRVTDEVAKSAAAALTGAAPRERRSRARRNAKRAALGKPVLPLWAAVVAAAAAGPLLDAAFPEVALPWLAFPAVALVLLSTMGRSIGGSLLVGLVFGLSFQLLNVIFTAKYLGPIPWLALSGVESVLTAVGSVLLTLAYRWVPRIIRGLLARVLVVPLIVAAAWTTRELWMGSWPYTGFPWARLGMTQAATPLAHIASWVGVAGLTFLMVAAVAMLIEAARIIGVRGIRTVSPRRLMVVLSPAVVTVLVLILVPAFPTTDAGTMRVGAVQGNGPAGHLDDRSTTSVFQSQLDATTPILDEDMDVLLWPEGSIDWDVLQDPGVARVLNRVTTRIDAPMLVNSATFRDKDMFNTSVLWDAADGGAVAFADKRFPVPMGEYVPDREFYAMLAPDLIGMIKRDYSPGTTSTVVPVGDIPVGLAICFDVIYDSVISEGAREGAQVFMFQTNNADFRDTDENLQQLEFARMRAVETGRAVVNISTVGTSQVIAPDGQVIDEIAAGESGAMVTDVPLRTGLTPAVVIGGGVQITIVVLALGGIAGAGIAARMMRRRSLASSPA